MSSGAWDLERSGRGAPPAGRGADLGDILERVLDKGVVIAGDIAINLLDIELLTIKLRLLVASADTAKAMGIDWWTSDPFLTGRRDEEDDERKELRDRIARLEAALALTSGSGEETERPAAASEDESPTGEDETADAPGSGADRWLATASGNGGGRVETSSPAESAPPTSGNGSGDATGAPGRTGGSAH